MTNTTYRTDFYAWTQEQAALLEAEEWEKLDAPHIKEELESMGASQRSALTSRLKVLLMHLLKWRYQPEKNYGNSWHNTIDEQRAEIADLLEDNPSLHTELPTQFAKAYPRARRDAARETKLSLATFPIDCPWTVEEILDEDWYPSGL